MSIDQMIERLDESGLLTADEVRAAIDGTPLDRKPSDGEALLKLLVKAGSLTAFQAQQVWKGKQKHLVIGNYVVLEQLGQGGMGLVFSARHRVMKRKVALKLLPPAVSKKPETVKRFLREVEAAARLNHPNIVAAYDAHHSGDSCALIMELVEGQDLAAVVKARGPLPVKQAVDFTIQAARGLQFAHDRGVIHRDIKPSNLLLDGEGVVKILDMGLARLANADGIAEQSELTHTGAVMGTVDYMSPEQALNTKTADARSDIYSLGMTFYFLLTGRPAYLGETVTSRLLAHQQHPVPSLKKHRAEIPDQVESVFRKMVAKKPADRQQSMHQVVAELEACACDAGTSAAMLSPPPVPVESLTDMASGQLLVVDRSEVVPAAETFLSPESDSSFEARPLPPRLGDRKRPRRNLSRKIQPPLLMGGIAALLLLIGVFVWVNSGPAGDAANANRNPDGPTSQSLPIPASTVPGALSFDGIDDYVEVSSLVYDPAETVTIEAWITPRDLAKRSNIVAWLGESWIGLHAFDGGFGLFRLGDGVNNVRWSVASSSKPGRVHLAGVWKDDQMRLFVNGRSTELILIDFHAGPTEGGLFLGGVPPARLSHAGERFFKGDIHAVRIQRGMAYQGWFTPPERLAPDANTLALYLFNERRGDRLYDRSGNNRHGRIYGAAWPGPAAAN